MTPSVRLSPNYYTPSRAPTPVRIGTTTISSYIAAVNPKPPITSGVKPIPKQRLRGRKIVDQHHGAPAIPAEVKAQRRPLPVDPALARVAGLEHPFAKAQ